MTLLKDLRDLAAMRGDAEAFSRHIQALVDRHTKKPALVRRFQAAALSA